MKKRILVVVLILVAIAAFGSGGYVFAKNKQIQAETQLNNIQAVAVAQDNDLYKQCLEKMPQNVADIESWHNSPEQQKLHQEMMANNPDMQTMHQQMMTNNPDMQTMHQQMMGQNDNNAQALHNAHHGIAS